MLITRNPNKFGFSLARLYDVEIDKSFGGVVTGLNLKEGFCKV
jgi:hypothetical protein